ncbi:LysR family transcriptional regulator [Halopseudomonas maritima]|uniref:LysR family transcriptional regulator n=1 Tax=Halopseudomonas maritima TaxID=2918528 RepID=UPI001EEB43EC|nr:LysR family transcriptional regulator [Halopseudomonas maritima]UJJ32256.1 LysR family transcriptional regulator [Halopseudomonas maritima]
MHDLNDMYFFVQVVEHKGFAPAGRALGIPKSRLSRRIAGLESYLGVRLLHRSTRQFSLTEIGRVYFEHCKAMLVEAQAAQEAVDSSRAEPCGVIRMTCPVALLHVHVGRMVAEFMAAHPKVEVCLEATNRRVDVVAEGVDLAIRVRPLPLQDSDLALRTFSSRGQCLVVSPGLVSALGYPAVPSELEGMPSMMLGTSGQVAEWELYGPDGAKAVILHEPRYITTDMLALREAALRGVGVVQLPLLVVREDLASGRLVRALPQWAPKDEMIHAVFPSRRGLLPSVRGMLDFLALSFAHIVED